MNPFTESTLAQPQPGVRWRRNYHPMRRTVARPRSSPVQQVVASAGSTAGVEDRQAACRPARASGAGSRAGALVGTLAFALALLMPGEAAATDVNLATPEQLQEVKGIGPKMARLIVEERDRGGKFSSIADLSDRVRGIGPKKAAALQESGLIAGGGQAAVARAASGSGAQAAASGKDTGGRRGR